MQKKIYTAILLATLCFYNASAQIITTFVGDGTFGTSIDGTPDWFAWVPGPMCTLKGYDGKIYYSELEGNKVRFIGTNGLLGTLAGTGTSGYSGDGGLAINAQVSGPSCIVSDMAGNIYFVDQVFTAVRKVSATGIITTIAGSQGPGYSGDGGPAILASFTQIAGICLDNTGNYLYISDWWNCVVRKVNLTTGIITNFAGNATVGFSGDGGPAIAAALNGPYGITTDNAGNVYIADSDNKRIRKISPAGIITTIAGSGLSGNSGDGAAATTATFNRPLDVTSDPANNLYIYDSCGTIRKINTGGIINRIAGTGVSGYSGDNGPPLAARINTPTIRVDVNGVIYLSDYANNRLRKIYCPDIIIDHQSNTDTTICLAAGTTAHFFIQAENATAYQWQLNSGTGWNNISNNATYTGATTPALDITGIAAGMNNYQYRCYATSNCYSLYSDTITMHVTVPVTSVVTITASNNNICPGTPVTFTAAATNAGTAAYYQWSRNGVSIPGAGGTNINTWTSNFITNGDNINCTVIPSLGCRTAYAFFSNTINMVVLNQPVPSIAINASVNNICTGTPVTFTANITNPGTTPAYQWKKNGANVGTGTATYTDNAVNNGDIIYCDYSYTGGCGGGMATSNRITMVVSTVGPPTIYIYTSDALGCTGLLFNAVSGDPESFSTTITNGGSAPVYQWKKNGVNVGINSPTYSGVLNINDVITCVLTSNSPCASPVSVTSNEITVDLAVDVAPNMTLKLSPATCVPGMPVTYTAFSMYAGLSPVYQWKKNGVVVGANIATYVDNSPVNGDIITCMITCSASCLSTKYTSAAHVYHCDACGYYDQTINTIISSPPGFVPQKPTVGYAGNLYYSSFNPDQVFMYTPAGNIIVRAGTGTQGYSGDGGPATAAQLSYPGTTATANDGTVYFIDQNGAAIRKIDPVTNIITTIANTAGAGGEGSPLASTRFQSIRGLAVDNAGNLYIADQFLCVVKKANMTTGITNTVAGMPNAYGYSGDGGPATSARMALVQSVAVDNSGNIYIADQGNNVIRKVNPAGIISTYAGNGIQAETGDGGPATSASFLHISDVSADNSGNIYINDYENGIRKVDQNGIVFRVAGNGIYGSSGDGGPATQAQVNSQQASVDPSGGSIYISQPDGVIRKVSCPPINIIRQPADTTLCNAPGNTYFRIKTCGANAYQWQVNNGSGWTDIINNAMYAGAMTDSLVITGATITMNNYQYRCHLYGDCNIVFSDPATLTIKTSLPSSVTINSAFTTMCQGANGIFNAIPVNGGVTPVYQWKKNGTNVGTNTNNNNYTDNTLVTGDQVSCVLTASSDGCSATTTATSNVITVNITPNVTPAITITGSANNICAGTSVTFSQTSTNGGTAPFYQWQKNGTNVAAGTTYTDNTLVNGDVIRCALLSNETCQAASGLAFSNDITMNIVTSVMPTIAIAASGNNVCAGTSTTFTATITNGGNAPAYQWKKNGVNAGTNNASFTDNTFNNGDIITCVLTSNAACASTPAATSNGITMIINPINLPVITITASSSAICAGTPVTFTAAISNGGTLPVYQWKKNGINVGTNNNSYTDNTLNNADIITCMLTSNTVCAVPTTVTSNMVTMNVNPLLTASISITTTSNTICANTAATFNATIINGGSTPVYQWKKNGTNTGTNNTSYTDNTLNNGDIITCVLTSNAVCAAPATVTSNNVMMTVNPLSVPSITVAASANNICEGTPVSFNATIINGGATPVYQWKKNGTNTGTNSSIYTDNTLNNADIISCVLTSNAVCASPVSVTSNNLTMQVNQLLTPAVSITVPSSGICSGEPGVFTAVVTNGGVLPAYQWKKNGQLITGANMSTYTDNTLNNNDAITCDIISDANCLLTATATSNTITVTIHDNPVIALDQIPTLCTGDVRQLDPGPFASYIWSTGQVSRTINVSNTGTYSVTVTDNNSCRGNASTTIATLLPRPANFLPLDTSFCNFDKLTLQPYAVYRSYNWSTGSHSPSITINQPGNYSLEVTDNNDCRGTGSVNVIMKQCLKGLYVPNAFTPNHDGKNDLFLPQLFGDIKKYEFIIYNRWGNEVFRTKNALQGWDGTFKGTEMSTQVFVWICSYQLNGEPATVEKGTVTLIR